MRRVKKKEDALVRHGKSRVVAHRDFGLKFGYIAGEFRPESYYAECVDLLRKLMLTGVLGLIHAGTVLQSFCSVVMSMFFLGLHIAMWVSGTLLNRPYALPSFSLFHAAGAAISLRRGQLAEAVHRCAVRSHMPYLATQQLINCSRGESQGLFRHARWACATHPPRGPRKRSAFGRLWMV